MEKEKICLLMARGEEIYNESFYKKGVVSQWYFSLTDEERDYLDGSEFGFCVPNTERVRVDKERREALREAREREGFLKELKKKLVFLKKRKGPYYSEAVSRAEGLLLLFKIRLPMPMGSESSYDYFSGRGWNACIMEAVKKGMIPLIKEKRDQGKPAEWAMDDGWNAAIRVLKKKYAAALK